jgi:hypothetical protein
MSEPVGPQYGLTPRLDRTPIVPQYDTVDRLSNDLAYDDLSATEFGGVAGLVQPAPHVPTASERLMQIHSIDPDDPGGRTDSVATPELEGNFNSEY